MSRPAAPPVTAEPQRPSLVRGLGALDGALLTIGAVVGTGIFLTPGAGATAVGHPWLVLAVWIAGGVLVAAGALAYAEMGAMFPRAGGIYHFLREAWGLPSAFLYGWTCLLVIMSGGIAAIAVGFGEYLGAFVPAFSSERIVFGLGGVTVRGPQLAAVIGIVVLTLANHVGLRSGAGIQNAFTWLKLGAIAVLIGLGLLLPGAAAGAATAPLPAFTLPLASAFGVALIAALWTYDGWYALTFSAGEVRDPERNVPRGLFAGIAAVIGLYVLLNVVYLRALGPETLAGTTRAAEAAAGALAGPFAARFVAAAVAVSAFGCLAATILYSSRVYQPMAADGAFFAGVATIHPRWHTPVAALWLQSGWAVALALSGSYTQLFTYVTFGGVLFHVAAGLAVFRLRATRPDAPRPYRAWGHPWVPALFVLGMVALTLNTFLASPHESLWGLVAIGAGLPAYVAFRRARRADAP